MNGVKVAVKEFAKMSMEWQNEGVKHPENVRFLAHVRIIVLSSISYLDNYNILYIYSAVAVSKTVTL